MAKYTSTGYEGTVTGRTSIYNYEAINATTVDELMQCKIGVAEKDEKYIVVDEKIDMYVSGTYEKIDPNTGEHEMTEYESYRALYRIYNKDSNIKKYIEIYRSDLFVKAEFVQFNPSPIEIDITELVNAELSILGIDIYSDQLKQLNASIGNTEFAHISNISGIFGLPYQFLPTADTRIGSNPLEVNDLGYEYTEKIIKRIPLLFLSPGKAKFMSEFSENAKKNVLEKLLDMGIGNDNDRNISDLLDKGGRYYTFDYDLSTYYKYVNPMCRVAAILLGIGDEEIPVGNTFGFFSNNNGDRKLKNFNWEAYTNSGISSLGNIGTYRAVPFYVDSETSIHENMSNSTSASSMANSINQMGDMAKELQFLFGYGGAATGLDTLAELGSSIFDPEKFQKTLKSYLGTGNFFTKLSSHVSTLASGGKLIFPEIWSDSSFSRSYSCRFKFISPDPSKLSVYLNVLVPLFHLIGLVAPQQALDNINGYKNPFIIRAIYKGMFNIDMGIITDMSITKGADCQWTVDGIPTSIEVSIDIKDLYQALTITASEGGFLTGTDILNNTSLMDYISNMCGINIYKPAISRTIDLWTTINFSNRLSDKIETGIFSKVQDKLANIVNDIYNKVRY